MDGIVIYVMGQWSIMVEYFVKIGDYFDGRVGYWDWKVLYWGEIVGVMMV